jgi:hypothetical protein
MGLLQKSELSPSSAYPHHVQLRLSWTITGGLGCLHLDSLSRTMFLGRKRWARRQMGRKSPAQARNTRTRLYLKQWSLA